MSQRHSYVYLIGGCKFRDDPIFQINPIKVIVGGTFCGQKGSELLEQQNTLASISRN
jgi:hypothetical protein